MIEWAKSSENRHSERKEGRQEGREGKRRRKREGRGKTGRQGRKEAAFPCFPCSDSEGYIQLACQQRGWRPWRLVELITYHSQNMCLLRRGVDTPFPPRREGHFLFMGKAHMRGTWQGLHYRLSEEAGAPPVTPKCFGENGNKMLSQMLTGSYQRQTWVPSADPPFVCPKLRITKAVIRKQRRFIVGTFL